MKFKNILFLLPLFAITSCNASSFRRAENKSLLDSTNLEEIENDSMKDKEMEDPSSNQNGSGYIEETPHINLGDEEEQITDPQEEIEQEIDNENQNNNPQEQPEQNIENQTPNTNPEEQPYQNLDDENQNPNTQEDQTPSNENNNDEVPSTDPLNDEEEDTDEPNEEPQEIIHENNTLNIYDRNSDKIASIKNIPYKTSISAAIEGTISDSDMVSRADAIDTARYSYTFFGWSLKKPATLPGVNAYTGFIYEDYYEDKDPEIIDPSTYLIKNDLTLYATYKPTIKKYDAVVYDKSSGKELLRLKDNPYGTTPALSTESTVFDDSKVVVDVHSLGSYANVWTYEYIYSKRGNNDYENEILPLTENTKYYFSYSQMKTYEDFLVFKNEAVKEDNSTQTNSLYLSSNLAPNSKNYVQYSYDNLHWKDIKNDTIPFNKYVFLREELEYKKSMDDNKSYTLKANYDFSIEGKMSSYFQGRKKSYGASGLFGMNKKLIYAGNLDLDLGSSCSHFYYQTFLGCENMTVGPEATCKGWTGNSTMRACFNRCTKLKTLYSDIKICDVGEYSFYDCFGYCSSLELPPCEFKSKTVEDYSYAYMFRNCSTLDCPAYAWSLPAETLAEGCYMAMFSGCSKFTASPAIKATTLAKDCFRLMFEGCTILRYIELTSYTGSIPAMDNNETKAWISGVENGQGVFYAPYVSYLAVSGNDGSPSCWLWYKCNPTSSQ